MNKTSIGIRLAAVTLAFVTVDLAQAADPLEAYPVKGQVIQRLHAFDNPEGSIFSADGRYVFVSSSADVGMPDKGLHWTHKAGYVSKLAVQSDGTLKMLNEKLITGLTGPTGMAVSTMSTKKFPKGTLFLTEAWAPLAEADGTDGQGCERTGSKNHRVQYRRQDLGDNQARRRIAGGSSKRGDHHTGQRLGLRQGRQPVRDRHGHRRQPVHSAGSDQGRRRIHVPTVLS